MKLGILWDDRFLDHQDAGYHPECPERLIAARSQLEDDGLWAESIVIAGREATVDELAANHSRTYVEKALDRMRGGPGHFDADTFFSSGSRLASLLAAGGTIDLAMGILDGSWQAGLALPRPPGHHVTPGRAMGFCIFNNIAVAARAALASGKAERILVFDWDVHHGNGTQDAFWEDDRVVFISIHQWPFYPGSGLPDEVGSGRGAGRTMNFPFPAGAGNAEYAAVIREVVVPVMSEHRPDIVLVSAGFDAHEDDLLGGMRLDEDGYAAMTRMLVEGSEGVCKSRIGFVLEGGYDIEAEARSISRVARTLVREEKPEIPEDRPRGPYREVMDRTLRNIAPSWKGLL